METCRPRLRHGPVDVSPEILETRIAQTTPVFSFAELYRPDLAAASNVRILLGAHATRFITNRTGERVVAVETVGADGRLSRVEADTFVLASGGIENARLLLCSDETTPGGLGNGHDLLGRFFMEHFYFEFSPEQSGIAASKYQSSDFRLYSGGVGDRACQLEARQAVEDARVWGQLVLSSELMRKEGLPALSLWFRPTSCVPQSLSTVRNAVANLRRGRLPERPLSDLRAALSDPLGTVRFLVWRLTGRGTPSKSYELRVQLEQMPDPENRIRLSTHVDRFGQPKAALSLRVDEAQRQAHARSLKLAADELGLNGDRLSGELERKYTAGEFDFFWHHMGTTRMSDDPTEGVVDKNCRVHGVANLFVAGSSVFPTATAAPTLTAVALAVRLADHIRDDGGETAAEVQEAMAR